MPRVFVRAATVDAPVSRILVIEGRAGSTRRLRIGLELAGHHVSVADDGNAELAQVRRGVRDLVILTGSAADIGPMLKLVREHDQEVLALAVASDGDEADVVMGLRFGADAYVLEPCGVLELLARVNAILRRHSRTTSRVAPAHRVAIRFGDIEVNGDLRTVTKNGTPVSLSPKEFELLMALARGKGSVVRRADLLREVWGKKASKATRTLDLHIAQLRRKLEADASCPRHILTKWKLGYRLSTES